MATSKGMRLIRVFGYNRVGLKVADAVVLASSEAEAADLVKNHPSYSNVVETSCRDLGDVTGARVVARLV